MFYFILSYYIYPFFIYCANLHNEGLSVRWKMLLWYPFISSRLLARAHEVQEEHEKMKIIFLSGEQANLIWDQSSESCVMDNSEEVLLSLSVQQEWQWHTLSILMWHEKISKIESVFLHKWCVCVYIVYYIGHFYDGFLFIKLCLNILHHWQEMPSILMVMYALAYIFVYVYICII